MAPGPSDFEKREEMQKEMSIFLKAIVNPMLLSILELSVRAVTERFGFDTYAKFSEAKKQVSFDERARVFEQYLTDTEETYYRLITPWVEEKIGRPFKDLSRYHALYLVRIKRFDRYFPWRHSGKKSCERSRDWGLICPPVLT